MLRLLVCLSLALGGAGTGAAASTAADLPATAAEPATRPVARPGPVPTARWGDSGRPAIWSRAVLSALRGHARVLTEITPRDIHDWCPAYIHATREGREAFWLGLVSALAKHESTYRPQAVGGDGRWYGLMQILPATARGYGCRARSGQALKDGPANLSCALRIMAVTVPRDGVVSRGMRGVAADWGPFHSGAKRRDMAAWTRSQSYCTGLARSLRPVARPMTRAAGVPTLSTAGPEIRP